MRELEVRELARGVADDDDQRVGGRQRRGADGADLVPGEAVAELAGGGGVQQRAERGRGVELARPGQARMPGGTGEPGPVAATSTRAMVWPAKWSARSSHHSGSAADACPVVDVLADPAGKAGAVPVPSHAYRAFCLLTALIPARLISTRPTPSATAPEASLRVLGHDEPSPDATHLFRRSGPVWLTFAAAHTVAALRGEERDWWALAWLRGTEIATDALWSASPALSRPGAKLGLRLAGVANVAMAAGFAWLSKDEP